MSGECEVWFKPKGKKTSVVPGTTILAAALEIGLKLRHNCGGNATCGTCRVRIEEGMKNLSLANRRELELLGEDRLDACYRLACQSKILGPVTVLIPGWLPVPSVTWPDGSQTDFLSG